MEDHGTSYDGIKIERRYRKKTRGNTFSFSLQLGSAENAKEKNTGFGCRVERQLLSQRGGSVDEHAPNDETPRLALRSKRMTTGQRWSMRVVCFGRSFTRSFFFETQ